MEIKTHFCCCSLKYFLKNRFIIYVSYTEFYFDFNIFSCFYGIQLVYISFSDMGMATLLFQISISFMQIFTKNLII